MTSVSFKGDNGKYLTASKNLCPTVCLAFSSVDKHGDKTTFVLTKTSNGTYTIKSKCCGTYWSVDTNPPHKVLAVSSEATNDFAQFNIKDADVEGMKLPDDQKCVVISNVANNNFCKRHAEGVCKDGLFADGDTITVEAKLIMETLPQV